VIVPPLSALLARSVRGDHLPSEIGPPSHTKHVDQSPERRVLCVVPWLPYPGSVLVAALQAACPIFFVGIGVCR